MAQTRRSRYIVKKVTMLQELPARIPHSALAGGSPFQRSTFGVRFSSLGPPSRSPNAEKFFSVLALIKVN
jgi:hypothetical protein